ncbi:hypothetical protein Tco_0731642 [Tanacetum coccineum]
MLPSSFNGMSGIVVPPRHILTTTAIPVDVLCPKLSIRYANARGSLSKCMLNTECHQFNLHDFGFEAIIQDEELPPWRMVLFGNDHFTAIMGYGDLYMGNILILHVYYVEGLGHNLFSIGQFCDSDLEVAFRKHTYMMKSSPICLLSKASKTKS